MIARSEKKLASENDCIYGRTKKNATRITPTEKKSICKEIWNSFVAAYLSLTFLFAASFGLFVAMCSISGFTEVPSSLRNASRTCKAAAQQWFILSITAICTYAAENAVLFLWHRRMRLISQMKRVKEWQKRTAPNTIQEKTIQSRKEINIFAWKYHRSPIFPQTPVFHV